MQDNKKHEGVAENAHLLPYGSNLSAPSFQIQDLTGWNSRQIEKVNHYLLTKTKQLKSEWESLQNEIKWNQLIFNAEYKFEPILGKEYYLYQKQNGNYFLSLVHPTEWNFKWIGTFVMSTDGGWKKID